MPAPFVTMKWGNAKHLTHALFDQGEIWVTATSQVRKIEDMDPSHVLNTLLMIERMDDLPVENLHGTKLYQALYDRMLSFLPKPPTTPSGGVWSVQAQPASASTLFKRVGIDYGSIVSILEAAIAARESMAGDLLTCRVPEVIIDYTDAVGITTRGRRVVPTRLLRGTSGLPRALSAFDVEKQEARYFLIERIHRCEGA